MDPVHVNISDNSGNPPMKSCRDRLHGELVTYRALIIYRLNTRILGDSYRFFSRGIRCLNHGSRGILITDHVSRRYPQSRFMQKKKYKSQFTLKISCQSRFTWLTPAPPTLVCLARPSDKRVNQLAYLSGGIHSTAVTVQ